MMDKRPISNAIWIIGCRIARALLNLLITMLTARYMGPSNFGLINYAASVIAFFTPMMMLGLNTTLVKELVENPEDQGHTLGTAITLNLLSAVICMAGAAAFVSIANPDEKDTLLVCILYSLNLPCQALEMIQYWYQAELKAKYTSLTALCAYVIVSAYKAFLLVSRKNIYWFAVSQTLDYFIIATILLLFYRRLGGQKMSFSWKRGKQMLAKSKYYIISAMMIAVFAQTDKVMLKLMQGDTAVGFYSAAVTCAGVTGFVFSAIIDTANPLILQARKKSQEQFERGLLLLYALIIYLALVQSVVVCVFGDVIIRILYGNEYRPAVSILRILVWYTVFSYIGAVRTIWILGEEKHSLLWKVNLCGAAANVVLNYWLIPLWGAEGAAMASLVTQLFANVLIGFVMPELRRNNHLIIASLNPAILISEVDRNIRKSL